MMSSTVANDLPGASDLIGAYETLAKSLVPEVSWIRLYDGQMKLRGQSSAAVAAGIAGWLDELQWPTSRNRRPAAKAAGPKSQWVAIPMETSEGILLGAFCACLAFPTADSVQQASSAARRLQPLLDCIHRDLAAARPTHSKVRTLTERTAELEWLFELTSSLKTSSDDKRIIEALLSAATQRLTSALGVLHAPDKRLTLTYSADLAAAIPLMEAWRKSAPHLMNWAQRQAKPLVVNHGRPNKVSAPCKVMSVPITLDNGRVLGIMAFYNPETAGDYLPRHVFLARHIGRQAATLIASQFDLMTGLYTRSGLEHAVGEFGLGGENDEQAV